MFFRSVAGWLIVLLASSAAAGQGGRVSTSTPDCLDQPTVLPPLLRPPADTSPPLAEVPRGPSGEYDHGHLYLPEYVAPAAPEACRPLGRWWVSPTFEFAWIPQRPAATSVRLRVPTGAGSSIPGPVIPVAGATANEFQPGFGLALGAWFNSRNTCGVDASLFLLGGSDTTVTGVSPGMLVIFPDGPGRSAPQLLAFPAATPVIGTFPATLSTWFIGGDVNYRHNVYCGPGMRVDALAGYRFAFLQDEFFLGETPEGGSEEYLRNRLAVSNAFHGGQVGLTGEYRADVWYVGGSAKIAFGAVSPCICTSGLFTGAEGEAPGGGYARLPALVNSLGSAFAVLPSMNVTLGRQLREHGRLFVGYSFQYLSRSVRLGDSLNLAAATIPWTDFWIQSFNMGFELRY